MAKTKRTRKTKAAKRVVVLLGSPKKRGNSAVLAERIAAGARAAGAEVETFYIQGMDVRPCTACEGCHQPESTGCVIDDDMRSLYPALRKADALVLATPIYWFTMSAQLKTALDRCYALMGQAGHAFKGRRVALAMAYGGDDPFDSGCVNAIRTFQDAFRFVGAEIVGMVYGCGGTAGGVRVNKALMAEATDLGRRLVG